MRNYHDLLRQILDEGQWEENRTGTCAKTLPGAMLKFDLREGFPAITTKKLAWKQVVGELIGFLRGVNNAKDFRDLGCTVWDQNANENQQWLANPNRQGEDDLGLIYGVQWREWDGHLDQVAIALDKVRNNPQDRRIIVSAWNPGELDQMALPPCHLLFQLLPRSDGTLHMTMYQRSCDMFLGIPFNIASYALLLELFALWTGRQAATMSMFLADVHIYENHIEQVQEQLTRKEYPAPRLWLEHKAPPTHFVDLPINVLVDSLDPTKIHLLDYQHHPALKAPMAV